MRIKFRFAHCLTFIALAIGLVYSYDTPLEQDEIKSILIKSLIPDAHSGQLPKLLGESSIQFAVIDTPIMVISSWQFSYNPKKIWKVSNFQVKRTSLYSSTNGNWSPANVDDIISENTFDNILRLFLYPFSIVAKRFRGYSFKSQKKRVEIDGKDCIKISVKPLKEDNDEESPFSGYLYITDEDEPRPIRLEHHRKSTTGTVIVRWEFKHIDELNCDFPYKMTVSTRNEMCNFKLDSQIKIFFGDFEVPKNSNQK